MKMTNLSDPLPWLTVDPRAPNTQTRTRHLVSEDDRMRIQDFLGCELTPDPDNQIGWLVLDEDVEWHNDGEGYCFAYCKHGSGILETKKGKRVMPQYSMTVFDDRVDHRFLRTSDRTVLFVTNMLSVEPLKVEVSGHSNYVQRS